MKKTTLFMAALLAGTFAMSAAELAKGVINNAIPDGWTYITNDPQYPDYEFYGDGGLKMRYVGQGILSPKFSADGDVEVVITINALNQNEKTGAEEDVFTITGLNAEGAEVATAGLASVEKGDNTATLQGTGIAQVKIIMTAYPYDGKKYCNVSLGGVTINGEGTPADVTDPGTDPEPTPGDAIFFESFATGQGDFTIYDVKNTKPEGDNHSVWYHNSKYKQMAAGAYVDGTNYETEAWLISPTIDLSNVSTATFTFDHAGKQFGAPTTNLTVQASSNYTGGDVTAATWTELTIPNHLSGETNDFKSAGDMDLAAFCGQANVRIAFKYTSTTTGAGNWYIQNVKVTGETTGSGIAGVDADETAFYVLDGVLMLGGVAEGTQVEIYNALGARMMTTVFDGTGIAVNDLNPGMYIVRAGKDAKKVMF